MNYPFSNEIKKLKEECKRMIDSMHDDEFNETAKFYGYDGKNEQFIDKNLPL